MLSIIHVYVIYIHIYTYSRKRVSGTQKLKHVSIHAFLGSFKRGQVLLHRVCLISLRVYFSVNTRTQWIQTRGARDVNARKRNILCI